MEYLVIPLTLLAVGFVALVLLGGVSINISWNIGKEKEDDE